MVNDRPLLVPSDGLIYKSCWYIVDFEVGHDGDSTAAAARTSTRRSVLSSSSFFLGEQCGKSSSLAAFLFFNICSIVVFKVVGAGIASAIAEASVSSPGAMIQLELVCRIESDITLPSIA